MFPNDVDDDEINDNKQAIRAEERGRRNDHFDRRRKRVGRKAMRLGRKAKGKEEDDERVKKSEIVEEELAFLVTIFYGKKLLCIDDIHFF